MKLMKSHFENKTKQRRPLHQTGQTGHGNNGSNNNNNVTNIKMTDSMHTLPDGKIVHYKALEPIGNGSFGLVFQARIEETNEKVAIKKVLQDKRYKNREIQIMKMLSHENIVTLHHCFYTPGEYSDELYLNLVLEYIPETIYGISKHHKNNTSLLGKIDSKGGSKEACGFTMTVIKYWIYQILKSLSYIHSLNICHRDIKPQNLLVYPDTLIVKLCDFGSAKQLIPSEPNVSYICSRYYRAPELIFGATNYTTAIDVWSLGCVFAELLLGHPIFPGESGVDQLVEIIKVLGTPKKEEVIAMNPNYTDYQFPQIKRHPWNRVFRSDTPEDCIDILSKMLEFNPIKRITAIEALAHPFFDELRKPDYKISETIHLLPSFYKFSLPELLRVSIEIRNILIPSHARNSITWPVNDDGIWPLKVVDNDHTANEEIPTASS